MHFAFFQRNQSINKYLTERQKDFTNRIVTWESVVIEDVQVQYAALQFLDGESCRYKSDQ